MGIMSGKYSERCEAYRRFIYSRSKSKREKTSDPHAENKLKQMDLILYLSGNIIIQRKIILSYL